MDSLPAEPPGNMGSIPDPRSLLPNKRGHCSEKPAHRNWRAAPACHNQRKNPLGKEDPARPKINTQTNIFKKRSGQSKNAGTSLAVQWFRLHAPSSRRTGSIPGWGTKNLHVAWCSRNKKNFKEMLSKKKKIQGLMASPFIVSRGTESSRSSAERPRELYSLPTERSFLSRSFSQMTVLMAAPCSPTQAGWSAFLCVVASRGHSLRGPRGCPAT